MLYIKDAARIFIAGALISSLIGCSSFDKKDEIITNPDTLFEEGLTETIQGNYATAAERFETLEREHPASQLSPEAHIRRAYVYYLEGKFEIAVLTIEEFLKQHPAHKSIAYMYYLRALCYYDQIVDIGRDQQFTYKAIAALKEVLARFPQTQYARDAQLKFEYATNTLAGKEMEIGRFYLNQNQLVSALNRFKTVVSDFQNSIFIEEALYRVAEIFYTLGDDVQAKHYAAVLGHNYPNSSWYNKAYSLIVDKSSGIQTPWYHKIKDAPWPGASGTRRWR